MRSAPDYHRDPGRNGVEPYWDRPVAEWPGKSDSSPDMHTRALDLDALLA